jgi:hypothetical protein
MTDTTHRPSAYEMARDSVEDQAVKAAWQEADKLQARKTQAAEEARSNPELSPEGVEAQLARIGEVHDGKVQAAYAEARRLAEERAASAYSWSLPAPGGSSRATLRAADSAEMMAVEARAASLKQRIEDRQATSLKQRIEDSKRSSGKKNGKRSPAANVTHDILREELSKVMASEAPKDDPETRVAYLAALRVAEDGIGVETVLDEFRSERHRRYAQEAQSLAEARTNIPSGQPRGNRFMPSKPRRNVRGLPMGQDPGARRGADSPATSQKRRRHW